mmetsp:Transcript_8649/g.36052  ORF Transcript_8649/g.36052 Transcript_8649/m.36052 type:complete len:509 (-) Transcript_8649:77-1603(-)|eukprot:CAMPEP_0114618062 /NCGR_PEP_ID=MMETSP0168-20121206/7514_1 /TAXON_ID=95228 ORGANISM="Vannella sp., Strain DIVA3 517/6/12" /NCGR_SAMPLE_ID=MMETSP0168 /ASSEMBLY_ACC=CAM_ASM_000044 /LENGTH=508 /DNA_ID=CAMNT_0001829207 /DNA_START=246 /DNA_END=1772 /DNA_ORIENTATION=+
MSLGSHQNFWDILGDDQVLDAFRVYLEKRHCEENLFFWNDVQTFKLTPTKREASLPSLAEDIFMRYLEAGSEYELNIDSGHKKRLRAATAQPTRGMFNEVQAACLRLMQDDSVPKFLRSNEYRALESGGSAAGKKEKKQKKKAEKEHIKLVQQLQAKSEEQEKEEQALLAQVQTQTQDIVEFKDVPVQEVLATIQKLSETCQGQPWLSQAAASMAAGISASKTAVQEQLPDTNLSSNIKSYSKEREWCRQVEAMACVLASRSPRTLVGFTLLVGRKWLGWSDNQLAEMERVASAAAEKGDEYAFGPTDSISFVAGDAVQRAHFLQFCDTVHQLIDKEPSVFQFSKAFVTLLARLTCATTPEVDKLELAGPCGDKAPVPAPNNVTDLFRFVKNHRSVFENPCYDAPELQEFEELLLFPDLKPEEAYEWNSLFENWRLSTANYLLDECIRVEAQRKKVVAYMRSASCVIEGILGEAKALRTFLQSVQALNVTEDEVAAAAGKKKGKAKGK